MDDAQRFVTIQECEAMIAKAVNEMLLKISRAPRPFKIFGLNSTKEYSKRVAACLGVPLTPHTEKNFEDGECYVKSGPEYDETSVGNVRGHNVFVIQSLYTDPNESVSDKLMKLCIMIGSLKDASAHEVIPIIPHLAWARQDRKTESRAPITTKYIAQMLEEVGSSRAILFDVHNLAAEQNAFRIPVDVLEAKNLFADWFAEKLILEGKASKVKILSPDTGGLQRCERFRLSLLKRLNAKGAKLDDIEIVVFDKLRVKGQVKGGRIVGDVTGAELIAYDDMISTASTMKKACETAKKSGGNVFAIVASHGLFCGKANESLADLDTKVVIADTVDPWRLNDDNKKKLIVIDTTKMLADAIRKIHSGTGSISELLRA